MTKKSAFETKLEKVRGVGKQLKKEQASQENVRKLKAEEELVLVKAFTATQQSLRDAAMKNVDLPLKEGQSWDSIRKAIRQGGDRTRYGEVPIETILNSEMKDTFFPVDCTGFLELSDEVFLQAKDSADKEYSEAKTAYAIMKWQKLKYV